MIFSQRVMIIEQGSFVMFMFNGGGGGGGKMEVEVEGGEEEARRGFEEGVAR